VIPTIRSLDFLGEWHGLLTVCNLVIVEDHARKEINPPSSGFKKAYHFVWEDIKKDFGKDEWIFSRKNAGIRSYGFWKSYQLGADVIVTLDDDCYPVDRDFIEQHLANLSLYAPSNWTNTFPDREFIYTRGIPYSGRKARPVVISHGLWSNKIDLDAKTQLKHPNLNLKPYPSLVQFMAQGSYFPMCSMNLAFKKEVTPLMYFPLMGFDPEKKPWGYDRFDDIWAGIFAKKILDHLNLSAVNGSPFVEHRKASDPRKNLIKEKRGIKTNEILWGLVDKVSLVKRAPAKCYKELAER